MNTYFVRCQSYAKLHRGMRGLLSRSQAKSCMQCKAGMAWRAEAAPVQTFEVSLPRARALAQPLPPSPLCTHVHSLVVVQLCNGAGGPHGAAHPARLLYNQEPLHRPMGGGLS